MPSGGVWFEEDLDGGIGEVEFRDKVLEKGEGGKGIVEGIVPISIGGVSGKVGEAEGGAEVAEGVGFFGRPGGAGELEGIDPGAEAVAGEGAEEAFFGAVPVGDDGAAAEIGF